MVKITDGNKGRLNILVTNRFRDQYGEAWNRIAVRYGYTDVREILDEDEINGRETAKGFKTGDHYDPDAKNAVGARGAFVLDTPPLDEMRAFIAELRELWGPLHVQDNSGLLPDLDNGLFRG